MTVADRRDEYGEAFGGARAPGAMNTIRVVTVLGSASDACYEPGSEICSVLDGPAAGGG